MVPAAAEDTAGQYTMFSDAFTNEGSLVPLPNHRQLDEALYEVSGRFEVVNGNGKEKEVVGPGMMVFLPAEQPMVGNRWRGTESS